MSEFKPWVTLLARDNDTSLDALLRFLADTHLLAFVSRDPGLPGWRFDVPIPDEESRQ